LEPFKESNSCPDDLNATLASAALEPLEGQAGGSAKRMFLKKSEKLKADRIAVFGPKLGKFANANLPDSRDAQNWEKGAI